MKRKGLTLLELMIALSIFSAFSIFMYRFFADEQRSIMAKHRQLDMHYNAALVMDNVEGLLKNNPGLFYDSSGKLMYKDSTRGYVLLNLTGNTSPVADLYFERSTNSFKDRTGNTISRGIKDIIVTIDAQDSNLMNIELTMFYGSGVRELQYKTKSTINIRR